MIRYCEVRLEKSIADEHIIKTVKNKAKSTIAQTTPSLQKHPIKITHSSTKKCEKIMKQNNEGCSPEYTSARQKKITRKSLILQNPSKIELSVNKKKIISGQSVFQVERPQLNKQNEYKSDEIHTTTRKRQFLEEENNIYRRKKLASNPPKDVTESSRETKQTKLKKKRNTHIIIWESKLTGAQRVSKRLSNLRTKNKNTGQMGSFNLIPLTLIKKKPVKLVVPNKMIRSKRSINKNKNRKERSISKQMLFLHKEQTDKCDGQIHNKHPKTPTHRRNRFVADLNPKITLQHKLVENQANEHQESVETTQISDMMTCGNSQVEGKHDEVNQKPPEETETMSTTKCLEEINVIQNTEPINLQNKENINKNDITENIEILQEDCMSDSDVIIVELGQVENVVIECPTEKSLYDCSCENKEDDTLLITDDVQCLPTQTEDKLKDNEEACNKTHVNTSYIHKTENVPEIEINMDETVKTAIIKDSKN